MGGERTTLAFLEGNQTDKIEGVSVYCIDQ